MQEPKRILVIIGSNVGDTICTTPAIKLLRTYLPNAQLGLVTASTVAAQVFQDNPSIDQIFVKPTIKEFKKIAIDYNLALDLHNSPVSNPYVEQLTIPYFKTPGPNPYHLRDHPLLPIKQAFPECNLKLTANYDLFIRPGHHSTVKKILCDNGAVLDNSEILVGVHMGCGKVAARALKFWKRKIASNRSWPFEHYRELYNILVKQNPNIRFVFTGTLGEQRVVKKYFGDIKSKIDLTGKTSLHELAALMSYCKLFLSGDTGPMHVASCTAVPMIALFGSTKPEVTGPYPMRENIICLQADSMQDIKVEQVLQLFYNIANC